MNTVQKNKVAIVTGGGSGIGLAIAEKFVANNILTIIVGRDEKKLAAAKEKLGELCVTISSDENPSSRGCLRRVVTGVIRVIKDLSARKFVNHLVFRSTGRREGNTR